MNKLFAIYFWGSIFLYSAAFGAEPYTLEKIVVTPDHNYAQQTLTAGDIKEKNLNSLADVLDYVSGMDLRYRGTLGVQGDLSLRGSSFEQVAVAIDGIKVQDPQTGHYNLDIPLTLFDIERVEVIKEAASSFYGAGAFAGSVNIVTKKAEKKSLNLDTLFGEHALAGQAISLSLPQETISTRVSVDHKISKAGRPNTDFEYGTVSFYANTRLGQSDLDTLFGYQKKDFGADSFYSNLFPEEEEHTETLFLRTGLESGLNYGQLKNNIFFRKHRDKFILSRNNPASVNYHTTYVYGLDSQMEVATESGKFITGLDIGRDQISSTNLGKHARISQAFSLGFTPKPRGNLSLDARIRFDRIQRWGWQESYNLGLGYYILDSKLKVKGSVSRAFRIPSFTELYYSDPANIGSPGLKAEQSDNFRIGLDYRGEHFSAGLEGYLRRGQNLIDWTRSSQSDPWQATNLGKVDFSGIEFCLKFKNAAFSYNYTRADKKSSGFLSKYSLDILKHQFILDIYAAISGFNLDWQMSYNQRYYGETYFVGNLYIGKKMSFRDYAWEPFIRIDNFTNTKYSEIQGVLQPGRWVKSGLKFEW